MTLEMLRFLRRVVAKMYEYRLLKTRRASKIAQIINEKQSKLPYKLEPRHDD